MNIYKSLLFKHIIWKDELAISVIQISSIHEWAELCKSIIRNMYH